MTPETISKLIFINRQFYQTFAKEFDATRQRIQPGVARVLDLIPADARILDLGCGNGEVARELARRGFAGAYVGVDFSEGLITAARRELPERGDWRLEIRDLTLMDWDAGLEGPFDVVLAFAVLHHLPSPFHAEVLRKVCGLLTEPHPSTVVFPFPKPQGNTSAQDASDAPTPHPPISPSHFPLFIFSNWQFLHSPRWIARIQPWERVGLTAADLAPNDYLLDWRRGGEGLRYIHHFTRPELTTLAAETGFEVIEIFESDGAEGNLGLYQVWRPK
ncbi:MAG: hypothetical protein Fur0022_17820 [Anaerolineales bacterium]